MNEEEKKRVAEVIADLVNLAETAMHQANSDGAMYEIQGELEDAVEVYAELTGTVLRTQGLN